jgi:hypothetical protein
MIGRVLQYLPDGSGYHWMASPWRLPMLLCGRWPRNGNPKCKRGSSGLMVDFISRSCRGHYGLLSVGITQSARVDDW